MRDKIIQVRKTFKRYTKESIVIITGQILIFAASIFGVKILTGVMTPDSYGELTLYNTIFIFSSMLLYNPLQQAISRFYNTYYHNGPEQLNIFESSIIKITTKQYRYNVLAITIFAVFFSIYKGIDAIAGCIFLLVYCITFSQITLYITAFNSVKYRNISTLLPLLEKILKPLCGALLIWYFYDSSNFALAGQAIAGVIVLGFSIILYRHFINKDHLKNTSKLISSKIDITLEKYMKSIPARTFFLWVFLSSDKWILEFLTSTSEVGLYSALSQIGYSPLIQVSSMVSIFISPYLFDINSIQKIPNPKKYKIINKGIIFLLMFTFILFVMGFYIQDFIFGSIIDKNFIKVGYLLPYVLLAGGIFITSQFYSLKAMIQLKPELLIKPSLITSMFAIIIYFILGLKFHTAGIVIASVLSNVVLLITTIYYCNIGKIRDEMIINTL